MVLRYLSMLAVLLFTAAASAQTYPTKPIRILTSGIGGGSDLITRMIAGGITGPLGQPIVVDNRGGMITAEVLAKAPPDGYTLMLMGSAVWLVQFLYDNVSFDAVRDFTPITVADASPNLVLVHPSVPAKSLKELMALAKAKPGALNWSSGATGAAGHLAGELFKSITGVDIVRIPYKSGSLETADFLDFMAFEKQRHVLHSASLQWLAEGRINGERRGTFKVGWNGRWSADRGTATA